MTSLERFADAFFPEPKKADYSTYGRVSSINPDGSYQVQLNASGTDTRCAKLCDAAVGDSVLVIVQSNGRAAAIGRVGAEGYLQLGGGSSIPENADLDGITAFGRYAASTNARAQSLSNCPTGNAFAMFVHATYNATDGATTYISQTLVEYDTGRIWYRRKSTAWQPWYSEQPRWQGGAAPFMSDSQSASVSTSSGTNLCSLSLSPGTWLVSYSVLFPSSTNGRRFATLGTTTTYATNTALYGVSSPPASGGATTLARSVLVQPTATTTYYLNAWQNSGGSLTCDGVLQAFRMA